MAVWSVVKKEELKKNRLDPEYYKPQFLAYDKKYGIKNELRNYIKKLTDYTANGSFASLKKNVQVQDKPNYAKWIRIQNLDFFDFENNIRFVDKHSYDFLKKSSLYGGEILISKTGEYLGKAYIFPSLNEKATLADNIFLINIDTKMILNEYFCVFFNSQVGNELILRNAQGTGQPTITKESLRSIVIPIPDMQFQKEIQRLYIQSYKNLINSKLLYSRAEKILLEALGLKNMNLKDDLFYVTTLKKVKENNRMDAEYYIPKYEKFMKHLYKYKNANLSHLSKIKKGIEPGRDSYLNSGKPFIRVSNLTKFGINNNNQKYLGVDLYEHLKGVHEPLKGEILLSKDATPGIAYVLKESVEGIVSSGILRLEVEQVINKEYLALVINSPIGQLQMKRDSGGSIIDHWKIEEIKNIRIPLLANSIQEEIEKLCYESFLKRKQAKQLLEEARLKVEKMIEKEVGY